MNIVTPWNRAMTGLTEALQELRLEAETHLCGRWVKLKGESCNVYVAETASGAHHLTWCDAPDERAVEVYRDPRDAILAGLRRARR